MPAADLVRHSWNPLQFSKCRHACKVPVRFCRETRKTLKHTYTYTYMATAQYERSGTRASAHPDPDPDPELRIKSPNSVPDPSVPDHRMQYVKSDVELGVRSIPVPYLFHTRSRPNKVFSTYSPCIIVGTSKRQSSFHTLRIKYAIQTLRIRRHRNVHSGHVVLISSHIHIYIYIGRPEKFAP